ncbi:hypothetical protein Fmac_011262 [Flemingia macrophylla]|uniref:Uncharacterized protein n=1 Tax=Flemingia macrophylla TaxID=520843 RepID=A0ABD1MLX8_9FABA
MIRLENGADVADAEEAGFDKSLILRLTLRPEKVRILVVTCSSEKLKDNLPSFLLVSSKQHQLQTFHS